MVFESIPPILDDFLGFLVLQFGFEVKTGEVTDQTSLDHQLGHRPINPPMIDGFREEPLSVVPASY